MTFIREEVMGGNPRGRENGTEGEGNFQTEKNQTMVRMLSVVKELVL